MCTPLRVREGRQLERGRIEKDRQIYNGKNRKRDRQTNEGKGPMRARGRH